MLRCQLPRFDQTLACLSLSHQFPMKVFGLQHTPVTNVARISLARFPFLRRAPRWCTLQKKNQKKKPAGLKSYLYVHSIVVIRV